MEGNIFYLCAKGSFKQYIYFMISILSTLLYIQRSTSYYFSIPIMYCKAFDIFMTVTFARTFGLL